MIVYSRRVLKSGIGDAFMEAAMRAAFEAAIKAVTGRNIDDYEGAGVYEPGFEDAFLAFLLGENTLFEAQVTAIKRLLTETASDLADLELGDWVEAAAGAGAPLRLEGLFNVVTEQSSAYADIAGGSLVVAIEEEIRAAIRALLVEGLTGEYTVQGMLRELMKVVGLDPRRQTALDHYQENTFLRLIREGWDILRARAETERLVEAYYRRLLRQRAEAIARTEIVRALNYGRWLALQQGILAGLIDGGTVKEWNTAEDEKTCTICRPLNGVIVKWDETFPTGDIFPPAHPNCRCTFSELPSTYLDEATGYYKPPMIWSADFIPERTYA